MDAAKQRLRHRRDGSLSEAPPEKRGDGLIAAAATRWNERFNRKSRARGGREQVVRGESLPCRRDAQYRRRRQRVKPAVFEYERGARLVGRAQAVAQAERLTEHQRRRLLRQDRVRPRFDRETIDVLVAN